MAFPTYSDVFALMKSPSDIQTNHQTLVTNLIARAQTEIEQEIGRKITATTFTDDLFSNGVNCEIYGNKLFLKGYYRDIYSVTAITETGKTLTAVADYNDGNDYYIDERLGCLIREGEYWSQEQFAIKMSGKYGLVDSSEETLADLKQVVIEKVAAMSGLWKSAFMTDEGEMDITRTDVTNHAKEVLKKYKLRDI